MEVDYGGFSIREYTSNLRSVQVRKCWPFSGEVTVDLVQSFLPPITVAKFRWWSHELASLLAKSPVSVDDSDPPFRHKAKAKSRQCKKRSIVEICATAPKIQLARREDEGVDSDVFIGSKRKRTKDHVVQKKIKSRESKDSGDRKFAVHQHPSKLTLSELVSYIAFRFINATSKLKKKLIGVGKCSLGIEESSGLVSLSSKKAGFVSKDHDSEFQIPAILKARRKVCFVRTPDNPKTYAPQREMHHVSFPDQSGNLSQLKENTASLEFCCLEMNRLSLSSSEDQSSVNDKQTKVVLNDQTSAIMHLESRQQDKFHPAVSKSDLSCFLVPHLSSQERVKDALDLERKGHVAQPTQSFYSTSSESPYKTCSSLTQHASADMNSGTLLYQSPFDPHLVEWMQKSGLYRERHVGEAISGFPLNLQGDLVDANGEGCTSFDRSSLGTASSKSASEEKDLLLGNLVGFSSEKKHSTEPALAKDSATHNEKRLKYFPARLGLDETFTEKAYFTNTDDKACGHTVHSPVSDVNPRSHTMNMWKQNGLNQNLNNGNVISRRDGLYLQNTQATMRLMGKDVSVSTSYSGRVRTGERIIPPDASIDYSSLGSHTHQSWLWRRTTLEVSENLSTTTTLDKNWNKALQRDTSKDPFPLFYEPHVSLASQSKTDVVPDSKFPPTILNPCCSLASFPLSDKDLNFHGSGLGLLNSFTCSQQQPPFPSNYDDVDIGLQPDARKPSFGFPFSYTDSTIRSQPPWPQSSFESHCSGMAFINPVEQQVSCYGSKSSSYINVNKRVASVEEYPMKNHKIPKLPMLGGLYSAKEFFAGQSIRNSEI